MGLDLVRFPFLPEAQRFLGCGVGDLLADERVRFVAVRRFCDRGYTPQGPTEVEVRGYWLGVLALSLCSRAAVERAVDTEVSRLKTFLSLEPVPVQLQVLRTLGVEAVERELCGVVWVAVPWHQFLRITAHLHDPHWKMVRFLVYRGYVHVPHHRLPTLCKLAYATWLRERVQRAREYLGEDVPEGLREVAQELEERLRAVRPRPTTVRWVSEVRSGVQHPPCMQRLLERLLAGEKLSHHERFALCTYLLHTGWSTDAIVDLFRNLPDFDEKVCRYQVEHIAGLRGSRRRYMVPSCDWLRTTGICVAECGVRNPLQLLKHVSRARTHRSTP